MKNPEPQKPNETLSLNTSVLDWKLEDEGFVRESRFKSSGRAEELGSVQIKTVEELISR